MSLGEFQIAEAVLYLTAQLTAGNPFVVLGPSLDDDDYTPAEGTGIIINGVNSGAVGFPAEPGHAYTFSLDINNVFQVMNEKNANGLWYRVWDNVGVAWSSWSLVLQSGNNGAWQVPTLQSNWVNYGGANQTVRYRTDVIGAVHIQGMVKDGTSPLVFVLPAAYRPSSTLHFALSVFNGLAGTALVRDTGNVEVNFSSATYTSLTGISYFLD